MRLGLNLGYWGAGNDADNLALAREADRLGFAVVWAAEAYGSDAPTVLSWVAAQTERIDVGSAILQIPARSPAMAAMTAATLDTLSGGRFRLGLGVSGPQVSEGWHGVRFDKPLARTREYVDIVRTALRRERVEYHGEHYTLPLPDGPGKALHLTVHPVRNDLPVYLAAVGPKNLELAGEIADGWLAIYFSLSLADLYNQWLDDGLAKAGRTREGFEVAASAQVVITDDAAREIDKLRPMVALYAGGMGAETMNFHADLFHRMGYGEVVDEIGALYRQGRRDEAAAAVPDELVREIAIIGDKDEVHRTLADWEKAGVTMVLVSCRDADQVHALAGN
jgi:F420-dependent oxidoreductase-like protein